MPIETVFAFVGVAALSVCATAVVTVPAVALLLAPRSLRAWLLRLPFVSPAVGDIPGEGRETADRARGAGAGPTAVATRLDVAGPGEPRTRALRQRWGFFRLDRLLSQTTNGQVWAAVDTRDQTPVVLKRPLPHQLGSATVARAAERLAREGIALGEAAGEHVVELHEAGEIAGMPFVAMRVATGGTLLDALHRSPRGLEVGVVVEAVTQIADALGTAHRAGWVHRDIKASNVVHDDTRRRWLLADFGIAQRAGEPAIDRLTAPGYIVGTPAHIAPELLTGNDGDGIAGPASDVYSLAVLTYQLLTGELPHPGPRLPGSPPPPPVSQPQSGPRPEYRALDDVLARALTLDPAHRYPDPAAFAHTLARVATHTLRSPSPAREPLSGPLPRRRLADTTKSSEPAARPARRRSRVSAHSTAAAPGPVDSAA